MNKDHANRILAVIPARGGSKGVPRKNIKVLAGKPLLAWTIEAAQASGIFERILLSTDDEDIATVGRRWGAETPFLRPCELAGDETPTALVIRHAVEWLKQHERWLPRYVVVLEPTSPSRRPAHIREAIDLLRRRDADSVASVSQVPHHYVPMKLVRLQSDGTVIGIDGTPVREMIHRRQDLPTYYAFNGLIFACKAELLWREPPTLWGEKVLAYVVDSTYNLDIDVPEDWPVAEWRFQRMLAGDVTRQAATVPERLPIAQPNRPAASNTRQSAGRGCA